jgi:hypothetical protein
MLAKNLGRHSLPPLRRISSRESINKIRMIPSIMARVRKGERHLRLHLPISGIQMEQKYKVHSLLPHRRLWGSGRWMCTWTASSRQIPPAIQRYIHTSVQRSDSNSSKNWVMGVSVARVLLPAYFHASSWRRGRRRRNSLLGEEWNNRERWASGRMTKTSWRKNRSGGDAELGRIWGFSIGGSG